MFGGDFGLPPGPGMGVAPRVVRRPSSGGCRPGTQSLEDQLPGARCRWKLANRRRRCYPKGVAAGGTSVGDLSVSSGSAPQLILQTLGSGPTPPVLLFYKINRVQVKSVMYTVIQF